MNFHHNCAFTFVFPTIFAIFLFKFHQFCIQFCPSFDYCCHSRLLDYPYIYHPFSRTELSHVVNSEPLIGRSVQNLHFFTCSKRGLSCFIWSRGFFLKFKCSHQLHRPVIVFQQMDICHRRSPSCRLPPYPSHHIIFSLSTSQTPRHVHFYLFSLFSILNIVCFHHYFP